MFERAVTLGSVLGFRIRVDWTWLILAVLIAWTLATGLFPHLYEDEALPRATLWMMGAAGALGLFASIVLHELGHAVVARRYGIEMRGITLFIFGGVAEMTDEPPHADAELAVAIAGPIVSVAIGGGLLVSVVLAAAVGTPIPALAVAAWLGWINLVLAGFNLIPAFPLDGGRVLRALLWRRSGDLRRATRTTSALGAGFGLVLVVFGVLSFVGGNVIGGVWMVILGLFLRGAASASYRQVVVRSALEDEPVARCMTHDPVTVPADTLVATFVEGWFHEHLHTAYPVMRDGAPAGLVQVGSVRGVPRDERAVRTVDEIAEPLSDANTIAPDATAIEALRRLQGSDASRLLVIEDGRLVGIVALKDLARFLERKSAFEDLERG